MDFVHKITTPMPRYRQIYEEMVATINANRPLDGVLLNLNTLTKVFQTSRTPVYQALQMLEADQLVSRVGKKAEFIIHRDKENKSLGQHPPIRYGEGDLREFFKNVRDTEKQRSVDLYKDMEQEIANLLPFGEFWINEQKAADHYNVSRTIIRQTLSKFAERGLIGKDYRSHWTVGPLTSKMLNDLFAIRAKLEPLALLEAAKHIDSRMINLWLERCNNAKDSNDTLDPKTIKQIEDDLHVHLLGQSKNKALLRLIAQTQLALVVNEVFAKPINTRPFSASLSEHIMIYEYLLRGAVDAAGMALETHITLSATRTSQRLKALSIFPKPPMPTWLSQQS
ncbi:GntR family transcriptional regulator [Alphaproteobacteria bacterium]|jgi:DNA-binding GntR family transcriptional regulator|nr:GntR family transcriptional regulator [Alphaproteobacteria bacterium]